MKFLSFEGIRKRGVDWSRFMKENGPIGVELRSEKSKKTRNGDEGNYKNRELHDSLASFKNWKFLLLHWRG